MAFKFPRSQIKLNVWNKSNIFRYGLYCKPNFIEILGKGMGNGNKYPWPFWTAITNKIVMCLSLFFLSDHFSGVGGICSQGFEQ